MSGALVAHELTSLGCEVVVLDRREPVHGSTLASSALLLFEIDLPLHILARRIGAERAARAYRRSLRSVERLFQLVHDETLRCGFDARTSLYLAGDEHGHRALATETEARQKVGVGGRYLSAADLWHEYAIDRTGGIVSEGCAVVNPAQLSAGLLRRVLARGGRVHSPVDVRRVTHVKGRVHVETAAGWTIDARNVVFCTGYELVEGLSLPDHSVKSTWAIATRPVSEMPAWLETTTVWEASDPYLYVRTTVDGRIVAGGEDADSSTMYTNARLIEAKAARIATKMANLLPSLSCDVSHAWAGAFGESPTGLPLIARVPGIRGAYLAAGFGGNGITHSVTAAEVVGGWIAGRADPDASLYRLP